jgi:hypothetical protein
MNDKGKEKEKERAPSSAKSDHSKLADTLTSVWGVSVAPASPLGPAPPKAASSRASARGTPSRAPKEKELAAVELVEAPQPDDKPFLNAPPASISEIPSSSLVVEVTQAVAADSERLASGGAHEEITREMKVPDSAIALVAGDLPSHSSPELPESSADNTQLADVRPDPVIAPEQLSTSVEEPAATSLAADPKTAISVTSTPKPATNTSTPKKKGKKGIRNDGPFVGPVLSPKLPPATPDVALDNTVDSPSPLVKNSDASSAETAVGTFLPTNTDKPSSLFSEFLTPVVTSSVEVPSPIETGIFDKLGGVFTPKQASSPLSFEVLNTSTPPKQSASRLSSPVKPSVDSVASASSKVSSLPTVSPTVVPGDTLVQTEELATATTTTELCTVIESAVTETKPEPPKTMEGTTSTEAMNINDPPKDEPKIDTPENKPKIDTPKDTPEIDASGSLPKVDPPESSPSVDTPQNTSEVDPLKHSPKAVDSTPQVDAPEGTLKTDTPEDMPKANDTSTASTHEHSSPNDAPEDSMPDPDLTEFDTPTDVRHNASKGGQGGKKKKGKKGKGVVDEQDADPVANGVDEVVSPVDKETEREPEAAVTEASFTPGGSKKNKKKKGR